MKIELTYDEYETFNEVFVAGQIYIGLGGNNPYDARNKKGYKMKKSMFFQEPWLLKKFSGKEQAQILAQYTREEQLIMLARFDLELQHWKDKNKNS